jgi:hypothetical protein
MPGAPARAMQNSRRTGVSEPLNATCVIPAALDRVLRLLEDSAQTRTQRHGVIAEAWTGASDASWSAAPAEAQHHRTGTASATSIASVERHPDQDAWHAVSALVDSICRLH